MKPHKSIYILLVLVIGIPVFISGCYAPGSQHNHEMAGHNVLSNAVRQADATTQDAYRFAIANPESLANVPCYCGCGYLGHVNNLDCYIVADQESEDIVFDHHALDCRICVDITQDVMRYLDQGRSNDEIYILIEETYSTFGPSNMEQHTTPSSN